MKNLKPILLVEDDQIDTMAVERALKELNITNPLVHKTNGEEATAYLKTGNTPQPCVVLLDISMPKMDGIELLKVIRADIALKNIPAVFMLSLKEDFKKLENLNLNIAGYISKPVNSDNLSKTIKTLGLDLASDEPSKKICGCRK